MSSELEQTTNETQGKRIADKYAICWGIAIDQTKGNVHLMASLLYKSLYDPDFFNQHLSEFADERFPDRLQTLSENIEPATVPNETEFTEEIRRVVTREVNFEDCLYPEALDQLNKLTERGKVIIWTQGDTMGTDEHPGSVAQLHKLVESGVVSGIATDLSDPTRFPSTSDGISVISDEDKFSDEIIEQLQQYTRDRVVFAFDDRLSNLTALQEKLPKVVPVWVQQDKHGHKIPSSFGDADPTKVASEYNAISNIADASKKIDELTQLENTQTPIFLLDYDGTIADDTKRAKLQKAAVLDLLQNRGWI